MLNATYLKVRRAFVFIIGSTIVLVGVVMLVTPGPAILVIPAGLALLATEFLWARRLLAQLKERLPGGGKTARARKDATTTPDQPAPAHDPKAHQSEIGKHEPGESASANQGHTEDSNGRT